MAALEHPHIVRTLGVVDSEIPLCLALELCPRGNLLDALRAKEFQNAKVDSALVFLDLSRQVAEGLAYLHSKMCLHRDVAARNVLLVEASDAAVGDKAYTCCGLLAKLSDLGLARGVESEEDYYRVRI